MKKTTNQYGKKEKRQKENKEERKYTRIIVYCFGIHSFLNYFDFNLRLCKDGFIALTLSFNVKDPIVL